jgi:hypothetical protein
MKKLIILLMAVSLFGVTYGQTVSATVKGNYLNFVAGTAAIQSETRTFVLDLGNAGGWAGKSYDYTIQLFCDQQSGTPTCTTYLYESVDGVTVPATALDSLAKNHASDFVYVKTQSSRAARYIVLKTVNTSATQNYKMYGYISVAKHN